jgi:hypothetical protein
MSRSLVHIRVSEKNNFLHEHEIFEMMKSRQLYQMQFDLKRKLEKDSIPTLDIHQWYPRQTVCSDIDCKPCQYFQVTSSQRNRRQTFKCSFVTKYFP